MIHPTSWFERKFTFDLPISAYPGILERLRGTPARLADRLLPLPRDLLTRRDGEDWSIQEHAGHLFDLCDIFLLRFEDFAAGAEMLRTANLENRKTYAANHNASRLRDILSEFYRERTRLVEKLENVDEAFVQRTALHPRLKTPMRVLDLAYFIAEHDDHHLAQITGLINKWMKGN